MTLLKWQANFRIGIGEVDHEHQALIGLINSLHDALGEERSGERVEAFLGEIFADISAHFALEEKVMRDRRYDALAEHKADHERLLDQLRDLMDAEADGAVLDDKRFAAAGRLRPMPVRHGGAGCGAPACKPMMQLRIPP